MLSLNFGQHRWWPGSPSRRWSSGFGLLFAALVVVLATMGGSPPPAVSAPAAGAGETICYGGDASFPPYEYLDEKGRPAGLNVDLIRAVALSQGFQVRIQLQPWTRVRNGLLTGAVDVATMYRSPQRAREADFAIPHELIYHEMFIRKGSPPLASLADLAGKRILVQSDTYSADVLSELGYGQGLRRVASEPEALRALARGEGEVAVVTQTAGRPFQERLALADQIVPTGPPILLTEYAFVTRKGNRALIERLNQGVASVKASGEYDRLYHRWIHPDRSAALARQIAWALSAALLIVLLIGVWNQALRRRVRQQTAALRREFEEKERALAALAESERSLRQAQKMEALGRLAGGVAHDFNNLLTIIINYASFLREELAATGKPTTDADEVLAASERAKRLTRQLLAFSRTTPLATVRLDLCQVVADMKPMIQTLVGEPIRLELVAPAAPVVVEADMTQIEQMLLNLAANARDAMPRGGRLTIELGRRALSADNPWALPAADYAVMAVADTGVGMDEETMARVFEPFFTTKGVGEGTGLGLATVFAHATKLGGRVAVQSAPGQGATFTIFLPVSKAHALEDVSAHAPATVASRGWVGGRILLVEDDEAVRRAARIALERAGFHVQEARDGEEALELAGETTPLALVVTDIVMPRRGGPQMVAELRLHQPGLPVLYVSGYVGEGQDLELDAPNTGFLAKPFTAEELLGAVHRLLATGLPAPSSLATSA